MRDFGETIRFGVRWLVPVLSALEILAFAANAATGTSGGTSGGISTGIPNMMALPPRVPSFDSLLIQSQQMLTMAACSAAGNSSSQMSCGNDELGGDFSFSAGDGEGGSGGVCRKLVGPDGNFSTMAYQQQMAMVNAVIQATQCEQMQMASIDAQINCMRTQATTMATQIASLQKGFEANIHTMQQDVQLLKDQKEDRTAQIQSLDQMLKGSNGNPGMLDMQKQLTEMVNSSLPDEIQQATLTLTNIDKAKKGLEDMITYQKITQTSQCFNQQTMAGGGGQGFRCTPSGPLVTAREYVICRYQQNQMLTQSGNIEQDPLQGQQVQGRAAALGALLDAIWANSYQGSKSDPQNPQQAAANLAGAMNQGALILTPADVDKYFGERLAAYNGKGLDIREFVESVINRCYSYGSKVVEAKRNQPGTDIGMTVTNLAQQQSNAKASMGKFVEKYSEAFEAGVRALTGNPMPLPGVDVCKKAEPSQELKCMGDIKTNLEGLLTGRVLQSSTNIIVKGTNPQTYVPIQCSGLNGCVRVLGNVSNTLDLEKKKLETFQKDYVLKGYQAAETFGTSMASMLSPQSLGLQQQINALNSRLSSLGISGISMKTYQSKPLDKDADNLPKAPLDVMSFVGGKMVPPLVDLGADAFNQPAQGIKSKLEDINKKAGKAQTAMQALSTAQAACPRYFKERLMRRSLESLQGLDQCESSYEWCSKLNGADTLERLQSDLSDLGMDTMDEDTNPNSALSDGVSRCAETTSRYETTKSDLDSNCAEAQRLEEKMNALSASANPGELESLKTSLRSATDSCQKSKDAFKELTLKDSVAASCDARTQRLEKSFGSTGGGDKTSGDWGSLSGQ